MEMLGMKTKIKKTEVGKNIKLQGSIYTLVFRAAEGIEENGEDIDLISKLEDMNLSKQGQCRKRVIYRRDKGKEKKLM